MGSRWKVTLITFILFLTSAGFSQDLDGLLSHCPSDVIVSEGIVDIKTSLARGASLLQGRETEGYEACVEECCVDGQCDLALYRLVGLSDSGNNCYFIQCGDPANCKIVKHNEFVFAFTTGEKTEGGGMYVWIYFYQMYILIVYLVTREWFFKHFLTANSGKSSSEYHFP